MKFKSIGLVNLIRVLRAWWPRATRTLGDAHGFGSRYAEISFRLVCVCAWQQQRLPSQRHHVRGIARRVMKMKKLSWEAR